MPLPSENHFNTLHPIPERIPGLDGLRAFSILIVMLSHSGLANVVPGVFGVTVFFFVSGFLITTLLMQEHARHGTIGIKSFYIRRLLRLYPPLIVSVLVTVLTYEFVLGQHVSGWGIFAALAYLANYMAILRPDLMQHLGGQLWSLAVEEHFYMFYPLVLLAILPNLKRTLLILGLLCCLSLAVRVYVELQFPVLATDYNGKATETRIDSILYGAIAALAWWSQVGRRLIARNWVLLIALGTLFLLIGFLWRNAAARETIRYTIQGLGLIPICLAVTVAGLLPRATALLESAPARWVGRHSYSLYLWHLFAFEMAARLYPATAGNSAGSYVLGWLFAFALAALSFRFVEQPFFVLRRHFGSNIAPLSAEGAKPLSATAAATPHSGRP